MRATLLTLALSASACMVEYSFADVPHEKELIVVTASYNNSQWCQKYFESLIMQNYSNWRLIYFDDNSTDGTYDCIDEHVKKNNLQHKVSLYRNEKRKGHLCNQCAAIGMCPGDSIIVIIDGDDWLAHDRVFQIINEAYQSQDIWLTYGQFWYLKKNKKGFCREIPPEIIKKNAIREISWRTSHLRTFYAGLFQQIKLEDLLYKGSFFPKCVDVVTMFAMIEMAGTHIKFIPEVLYIYNDDNPLSYHHDPTHQRELEAYIRTMPRYEPLKEKLW